MSDKLNELQQAYETADAAAIKLSNEYDDKRRALKEKYHPRLEKAVKKAADAQKAFCDAEAAEALLDRPDGEALAERLGLELPS